MTASGSLTVKERPKEQAGYGLAQSRAVAELSRQLGEARLDHRAVLDTVARCLAELIGDGAVIRLLSDDGQWAVPVAVHHSDLEAREFVRDLLAKGPTRSDEGMLRPVMQSGQPLLMPVVSQEQLRASLNPELLPYLARYGIHSLLIVPLRVQGKIAGAVSLSRTMPGRPYTLEDQVLLQDLADRAASAIANSRLHQALEKELSDCKRDGQLLAMQYALTRLLAEATALRDTAPRILQLLCECLGWDAAELWRVGPDSTVLRRENAWYAPGLEAGELESANRETLLSAGNGLAGRVWASGRAEWIPDIAEAKDFTQASPAAKVGLHAAVAFPIRVGSSAIGAITSFSRGIHPPDMELLLVLEGLGSQIGNFVNRRRAERALVNQTGELERSNAELEQFAYVASHDLQEPLRMVTSYLQLLQRRYRNKLDADGEEFIAFAVDGANRMKTLIQDLLAYSRTGTRSLELLPTDVEMVLGEVLLNLKPAIEESAAAVTHDPLPMVMADRVQLTQLLQNLIGNAIKFRDGLPPRVHLGAGCQNGQWVFSVRDEGIGMDAQHLERIFVIFQRLHSREQYPGTGIGLAICKKIVERHGGRISVESEPGRGSTFYFILPGGERN